MQANIGYYKVLNLLMEMQFISLAKLKLAEAI